MSNKKARPEGYITRAEFALAVKKGKTTIRRWEQAGKVTPTIGADGVRLYRVEDAQRMNGGEPVESLARARPYVPTADSAPAEIGALVFERLAKGETKVQIVCALKNVHPDIIEGFCVRYERMSDGMFFDAQQKRSLCQYLQLRRDADGAAIIARAARWATTRVCTSCRSAVAQHCSACYDAYGNQRAESVQLRWEAYYASNSGRGGGHRTASTARSTGDAQTWEALNDRRYEAEIAATDREHIRAPIEATSTPQTFDEASPTAPAAVAAAETERRRIDAWLRQQPPIPRTPEELQRWLEKMNERGRPAGASSRVPDASSTNATLSQQTTITALEAPTVANVASGSPPRTVSGDDRTNVEPPPSSVPGDTSVANGEAHPDAGRIVAMQLTSAGVGAPEAENETETTTAAAPPAPPERSAAGSPNDDQPLAKPAVIAPGDGDA